MRKFHYSLFDQDWILAIQQAKMNAKTFDRIISVTKFTNHKTHKHYKRYSGYTMVAGGFSSVAAVLATLLS